MQEDVNIYTEKSKNTELIQTRRQKYINLQEYTKIIPKYTKVYKKTNSKYQNIYINPSYKYQTIF